jgi:outer membrane immunogenic protein
MKKIALAVVAASIMSGSAASAADLARQAYTKAPPPVLAPVYSWTGFYVGGNIGGGWSEDSGATRCTEAGVVNGPSCQNVPGGTINGSGVIGGVQAGYNWQVSPNWLIGVEADIQGADIKGSTTLNGPFPFFGGGFGPATTYTASEKIDWFGTVRGRVGMTTGSVLLYVTGGLAYGHARLNTDLFSPGAFIPFSFPASASVTKAGWTVGGGVEWGFASNWSVKVEGLYYDLGTTTVSAGPTVGAGDPTLAGFARGKDFNLHGAIGRVGLNYRFGGPVVAKY